MPMARSGAALTGRRGMPPYRAQRTRWQNVAHVAPEIMATEGNVEDAGAQTVVLAAAQEPLDMLRQQVAIVAMELEQLRAERDELEAAFAAAVVEMRTATCVEGELVAELVGQLITSPWSSDGSECSCAICLCDFRDGEQVAQVPVCSHTFHTGCISQWFGRGRAVCPMCRLDLRPARCSDESEEAPLPAFGRRRQGRRRDAAISARLRLAMAAASRSAIVPTPGIERESPNDGISVPWWQFSRRDGDTVTPERQTGAEEEGFTYYEDLRQYSQSDDSGE